jgi:glutathione S-transferase
MVARRLVVAGAIKPGIGLANDGDEGRLGPLLYRNRAMRQGTSRIIAQIAFRVNAETERALLAALPPMLDRIDGWIEDGILNGDELNAADYMIAPSLAVLSYRADAAAAIEARPAIRLLDRILPDPRAARPLPVAEVSASRT